MLFAEPVPHGSVGDGGGGLGDVLGADEQDRALRGLCCAPEGKRWRVWGRGQRLRSPAPGGCAESLRCHLGSCRVGGRGWGWGEGGEQAS